MEKKKILIVEDDKYIVNFISMALKKEDYGFYTARTVETLLHNRIDYIPFLFSCPENILHDHHFPT